MDRDMNTTFAFGVILPSEDNLPAFNWDKMEELRNLFVDPSVGIEVGNYLDYMHGIFVYLKSTKASAYDGIVDNIKITHPTDDEIIILLNELEDICTFLDITAYNVPGWCILTSYF